jgi:hypothetical protein
VGWAILGALMYIDLKYSWCRINVFVLTCQNGFIDRLIFLFDVVPKAASRAQILLVIVLGIIIVVTAFIQYLSEVFCIFDKLINI